MKIALLGYGKMNRLIEQLARAASHEIVCVVRSDNKVEEINSRLGLCDVAIDFSIAAAVNTHARLCAQAHVPLVEGTTGWLDRKAKVEQTIEEHGGLMLHGANFSIGVNVFYRIVRCAAELLKGSEEYDAFIEEAHHRMKRDAPSGTALQLQGLLRELPRVDVPITSTRAGFIPGTHRVSFDSAVDTITLEHTARSREGFARGALRAAEYLATRGAELQGVFEFGALLDDIIGQEKDRTLIDSDE